MIRRSVSRVTTGAMLALLLGTAPALPQEVLGRSLIDGRTVELLSNQTWRFVDAGTAVPGCDAITSTLSFCGAPNEWKPALEQTPDIARAYRYDDRHYAQFIIEELGSDDGLSLDFMRAAVIDNAAASTGLKREEISVLDVLDTTVGDHQGQTVVYAFAFDGLNVVFANTVIVDTRQTLQAMTYAVARDYTQRHKDLHSAFLAATRLEPL